MPSKKTNSDNAKQKKPSIKPSRGSAGAPRVRRIGSEPSADPGALRKSDRQKSHQEDGQVMEDVQAQIAQKAHELYEQRGRFHGHDFEDWLEAERHVLGEKSRA